MLLSSFLLEYYYCDIQISRLTIFDIDNPEKAIEIPTKPGCMHKADTYYDEEHPYPIENSPSNYIEQPSTESEKKALHFFDTGIDNT